MRKNGQTDSNTEKELKDLGVKNDKGVANEMLKLIRIILIFLVVIFFSLNTCAEDQESETDTDKKEKETIEQGEKAPPQDEETLQQRYMDTVVVSGSMGEELYWDTTSAMTVFKRDMMNKLAKVTVGDILRYSPGVTVQTSGSIGKITTVRLRGANSNQTLLLIDGVPLNDPALGTPHFAPLTSSSIGRLEVVRGSHSPLYGTSASGGVVNIFTQKGKGDFHFTFYGEADNKTIYDSEISMSGKTGKFSYYVDFQTVWSDGQWDNDNYENTTFNTRLGFDFSESTELYATFHYIDSHLGIPIEVFRKQVFDENSKQDDRMRFGSLIFRTELFGFIDSRLSLGYYSNRQKFADPADEDEENAYPVNVNTDSEVVNFNFTNNFVISDADELTLGMEIRSLYAKNRDVLYDQVNYDEHLTNFGIFLQNRYNLNKDLYLTASLRYDDFGEYGDSMNPRIAAAYMPGNNTKVTAAYSTGFRVPSLNELFYPYYGNADLKPEESDGFEFGIEQFLANGNLHISANLFFTNYTNLIGYSYEKWMADNIDKAAINGFELMLDFKTEINLSGSIGYTGISTDKNDTGEVLIRRPESQLFLSLLWETGDWEFLFLGRHTGRQLDNPVEGFDKFLDPFFVADLNVRYLLHDGVRLMSGLTNLFDVEYYEVKGYPARKRQWFIGFSFNK